MKHLVLALLLCSPCCATSLAADMPVSAEIVDVPSERRDWGEPIGNVRVKFADGHSEFWTRLGRCMDVRRSDSGLVGWSRYTERNSYGEPVNSVLRVMVSNERWMDFQAGPFINDWNFADHDSTVIVKSRGRHGPSVIQRFSLKTGKLVDSTKGSSLYSETPDWAKPFADDRP